VQGSALRILLNFGANNPPHRQVDKHCVQPYSDS
jgi:hypothetical protein